MPNNVLSLSQLTETVENLNERLALLEAEKAEREAQFQAEAEAWSAIAARERQG